MAKWTRFLTPGTGRSSPDLGCALDLRSPNPSVQLFVVHLGEIYRLNLSLTPRSTVDLCDNEAGAVVSVQAAENPNSQADSVAIRLEVRPGKATFSTWTGEKWRPVGDFSGGVVSAGGRMEITGDRQVSRIPQRTTTPTRIR